MEVGRPARQRLLGGAQSFERRVPGVGQHDKPGDTGHHGVIHDDEDGDARQCLGRPVGKFRALLSAFAIFYIDEQLKKTQDVRRFPQPHCVVALAHDLFASAIQKLG